MATGLNIILSSIAFGWTFVRRWRFLCVRSDFDENVPNFCKLKSFDYKKKMRRLGYALDIKVLNALNFRCYNAKNEHFA